MSLFHHICRSIVRTPSRTGSSLFASSTLCNNRRSLCSTTAKNDDSSEDTELIYHPPLTTFTEDETLVRDAARTWARQELSPQIVRDMDRKGKIRPEIIHQLFQQGYMGMEIDVEYGGAGMSFTSACLVVEEISRADPSVAILVDIHNTLTNNAVRFWGSDSIKEKYLPKLATDTASSFCLSEAESGSDAFSLRTTATKSEDGSYYILQGNKLWISNAPQAGVFLVFANANPALGYKGITAFLVDAESEGIAIGNPESKLGLRASATCPISFDNVKVDANNILGQVGEGYKYCIQILNEGRIGIAAQQIGIAKACLHDIAMPYMLERKQFSTPIANFQGMQHQYAQIATEIHAAELLTYNACRLKENGFVFIKEASMAKLYASQVAERAASKTIEWLGGIGFTSDLLAEKFYRDCKVGSIYEGTSNIQLQTIAKQMQAEYKP